MQRLIRVLSTGSLERLVTSLVGRLIRGTATGEDIDHYVLMQLELAERELGRSANVLDPRD